jgi:hypothetical protein
MKNKVLLLGLSIALSGCFHGRVVSGARAGPMQSELGLSLFWGLTESKTTPVECKNGLAVAGSYLPWWWWLLSGITVGILTPVTKEYACNEDSAARAEVASPISSPK